MGVSCDDVNFAKAPGPAVYQSGLADFACAADEEIWSAFKNGSEPAFEFIYTKYFPILFNYGRQFTRDSDLVKDIIQDLFIYLQEKKGRLGAVSSIKFYLYKSYRNRITGYLNKSNLILHSFDFHENNGFEIMLTHDDTGSSDLDEELRQKMESAFALLSERQKEIIIYYFYEGFSYAQITTIMGFGKIEYARILMSRTILKLRKLLGVSAVMIELILLASLAKR
jgi:RNA polymerase sigma factor (sigma-70 family)